MGTPRQSPPSPELKIFSDRLQKAIEFKKTDLTVLAKDLDYKPDDIHRLLAGMREPSMKKLILLANSLGCSVDYLLGLTLEAKRATVTVLADTDALDPQAGERGQTSGQISGKAEQFIIMLRELLESDVELLMYLAGFLIERKEKRLSRFAKAITAESQEETEGVQSRELKGSGGLDDYTPDPDDDDFDEDELWDDVDDDFESEDYDDEYFEEYDDSDDDYFDD